MTPPHSPAPKPLKADPREKVDLEMTRLEVAWSWWELPALVGHQFVGSRKTSESEVGCIRFQKTTKPVRQMTGFEVFALEARKL